MFCLTCYRSLRKHVYSPSDEIQITEKETTMSPMRRQHQESPHGNTDDGPIDDGSFHRVPVDDNAVQNINGTVMNATYRDTKKDNESKSQNTIESKAPQKVGTKNQSIQLSNYSSINTSEQKATTKNNNTPVSKSNMLIGEQMSPLMAQLEMEAEPGVPEGESELDLADILSNAIKIEIEDSMDQSGSGSVASPITVMDENNRKKVHFAQTEVVINDFIDIHLHGSSSSDQGPESETLQSSTSNNKKEPTADATSSTTNGMVSSNKPGHKIGQRFSIDNSGKAFIKRMFEKSDAPVNPIPKPARPQSKHVSTGSLDANIDATEAAKLAVTTTSATLPPPRRPSLPGVKVKRTASPLTINSTPTPMTAEEFDSRRQSMRTLEEAQIVTKTIPVYEYPVSMTSPKSYSPSNSTELTSAASKADSPVAAETITTTSFDC